MNEDYINVSAHDFFDCIYNQDTKLNGPGNFLLDSKIDSKGNEISYYRNGTVRVLDKENIVKNGQLNFANEGERRYAITGAYFIKDSLSYKDKDYYITEWRKKGLNFNAYEYLNECFDFSNRINYPLLNHITNIAFCSQDKKTIEDLEKVCQLTQIYKKSIQSNKMLNNNITPNPLVDLQTELEQIQAKAFNYIENYDAIVEKNIIVNEIYRTKRLDDANKNKTDQELWNEARELYRQTYENVEENSVGKAR